MHITQLRLQGFKSFVEPTDLQIRPGLTGVVGPNGCGKSNLLEALRWVMGETSFKAMRGGAMEDVIFAGTQTRPQRNSASVSVFVDNSARTAPAEFNDEDLLEITRLIRRGEGSSYQVNGRGVRAKDVKLLFEDAATGARSHALVRQGQIGEIVNSKPEARRRILEDAAGIAGLHSRRHEAELRLNAAEANLERLSDVMGQVDAQLTSLKRQARHAQRYKELSQRLRALEALQLYLKWRSAGQLVHRAEEELQAILNLFGQQTRQETAALTQRERLIAEIAPLRDEEITAAAVLQRLSLAEEALTKEEQQKRARQEELNRAQGEARADLERDQALIHEGEGITQRLMEDIRHHRAEDERLSKARDCANLTVETAKAKLKTAEQAYAALSTNIAGARASREALRADLERLNARASRFNETRTNLAREKEELLSQLEENGETEFAEDIDRLEQESARLETLLETEESGLETSRDAGAAKAREKSTLELDLRALTTEIGMIEKLISPKSEPTLPPLIDDVKTESGYETALAALLGEALDAPLIAAEKRHPRAASAELSGYWLSLRGGDTSYSPPALPPLPSGVPPLSDFVHGPEPLMARLEMTGLVSDDEGAKLQAQLHPGQCLVSRQGGLWRWDGYCVPPQVESSATLRLRERNRLPALLAEKQQLEQKITELESALTKVNKEQTRQSLLVREHRQILSDYKSQLRQLVTGQNQALQQGQKAQQRLAAIEEALTNAQDEIEQSANRSVEVNLELARMPAIEGLSREFSESEADVTRYRDEYSAAHVTWAGLKGQAEMNETRLKQLIEEEVLWTRRAREARGHVGELETRIEKITTELSQFADYPAEISAKRAALFEETQKAEARRQTAADQLAEAETLLQQHETTLRKLQSDLIESREEKARVETRLEGGRASLMQLANSIEADLHVKPDGCLELAGLGPEDDLPRQDVVEADLLKVRRDRDRLGAVNLRADDEIRTLEEQFGGMATERDDLTDAIAQLRCAVQQLNEEGRQRLLKAFDAVNSHFKRLFQTLFAGGEAELKLVDSDDPLDAGLEIIARPPGKKPQVLTLLSGGEKALTAMSLIFAVFLTNPSPICVLDEVDAPLDDSNVDRFCLMMEEMARSTDTRFLVITHHPMTMERMDRLYGVTMSEKGISQLVSVDLNTAASLRDTA